MKSTIETSPTLDKIDTEKFFRVLSGKLTNEKTEMVAAALADAIVGKGFERVIDCSMIAPTRLIRAKHRLSEKLSDGLSA